MPASSRQKLAFTAIEMLAVLFLAALAAGLTVVSLEGLHANAAASEVVDRIAYFDGLTRESARHWHVPLRLVIDLQKNELRTASVTEPADSSAQRVLCRLPDAWRIGRAVSAAADEEPNELSLPISANGRSTSYALELLGPGSTHWIVVLGLSGQVIEEPDENRAEEILHAAQGHDAD